MFDYNKDAILALHATRRTLDSNPNVNFFEHDKTTFLNRIVDNWSGKFGLMKEAIDLETSKARAVKDTLEEILPRDVAYFIGTFLYQYTPY